MSILHEALESFPNAPCLKESVSWGVGGGAAIGALRFLQQRGHPLALTRAAFSGAVVLGLTSGMAWMVCRRELHAGQRPLIEKLVKLKALQDSQSR
ncbi:hypothetical protein KFE25_011768 [Diacronema lutheri]|uniref:Cytochrome c oxidase assembly protein COX20, mitochondrial n=1 Tax=Diacronema lutheri TaxID=2081491 RepID=A0A8J5XG45_DIALT|nr:hypothetical protein KFE25_011768 [Diacronema lutheri]